MDDETKQEIIAAVMEMMPKVNRNRLKALLELILLEVESFNHCGNQIDYSRLSGVISEVLYQSLKTETEKTVASIRRGDTTISYATSAQGIRDLLAGYSDLIKRVIGCGSVVFY